LGRKTLKISFPSAALILWAGISHAFDYPALHSVVGVDANDVLNVRSAPSAAAQILGALKPTAEAVEVLRTTDDGKWGLINIDEATGWTAMRFLKKTSADYLKTQCFGTEPFWGASFGNEVFFELAGETPLKFRVLFNTRSTNRTDRFATIATRPAGKLIATTSIKECSDGMSDRLFGLSVEVLVEGQAGWSQFSGCCSLQK
jgi:uncharacterized membrane protein